MQVTADYIFDGEKIRSGIGLTLSSLGEIIKIDTLVNLDKSSYQYYPGLLTPGFVNCHCHLELSHLHNRFQTGTGLIPFLKAVVTQRDFEEDYILQCIQKADEAMYKEGIVAVGDISNKTDTIETKLKSKIKYYNFIECFDFHQEDKFQSFLEPYLNVFEKFGNLTKSLVPHAPYSVSRNLFREIIKRYSNDQLLSIHNQEFDEEDKLFIDKTGGISKFFNDFGFSMDQFKSTGQRSIQYALEHLPKTAHTLFIHNTCMNNEDVKSVQSRINNAFFVTCPNANLFIENRLPYYQTFIDVKANMAIGTDSLSSNWSLSILEEIKTILNYQSYVGLEEVLKWATSQGAKALKMHETFGSFTSGKFPGVNWIADVSIEKNILNLKPNATVHKII